MHCWELETWPNFYFTRERLSTLLEQIEVKLSRAVQKTAHLPEADRQYCLLETMVEEAKNTSSIEGEFVSREDIRSSILNLWRIGSPKLAIKDKRALAIGKLMGLIMADFQLPIHEAMLKYWHAVLFAEDKTLRSVGDYRLGPEPMRIISGPLTNPVVHYEAPPAKELPHEMRQFVASLRKAYADDQLTSGIIKSGIAHLYFESIHPFEDGNGRIGRALIDYILSQTIGQLLPFSLSQVFQLRQKEYYAALSSARKNLDATEWMVFYLEVLAEAISIGERQVTFVLHKTRIFDQFSEVLSANQQKVIGKLFDAGPHGFDGGLSAKNYLRITGTSRATTTRELAKLTELGILKRSGAGRGVRYQLNV